MMPTEPIDRGQDEEKGCPKRPWQAPRLVEYGDVAKLTQGTQTVGNDGGPGMMNMACL